eukprot:5748283-Pyramimonas_sp.AAC.1
MGVDEDRDDDGDDDGDSDLDHESERQREADEGGYPRIAMWEMARRRRWRREGVTEWNSRGGIGDGRWWAVENGRGR